jgi:hypothetical protein
MTKGRNAKTKMNFIKTLSIFALCAFILTACRPSESSSQSPSASPSAGSTTFPEKVTPPSQTANLATPVSQEPAVGICSEFEGGLAVITVYPDISYPRCAIIKPDQMLKVVNSRQETLRASIANMTAGIDPDGEHLFNMPFGQYLAPGVHLVQVKPCCGASLWLK